MNMTISRFRLLLVQSLLLCVTIGTFCSCNTTRGVLDEALRADYERDFTTAIALYTKVIEADAGSYDSWNNRGYVYLRLGRFDSAIADFSRAVAIAPTRSTAWYNRAIAYRAVEQYDSAIADYTQLMEMDPLDMDIQMLRARTYSAAGKFSRAIEDYDVVLSFDRYYYRAYSERGIALMHSKNYAQAIENANEAVGITRSLLNDLQTQGFNRYWNPQWQPGISEVMRRNSIARAINQYYSILSSMFVNRATVYSDTGLYDRALDDYRSALTYDSTNTHAYGGMGWTYYLKNDFQACIELSEQAVRYDGMALYARYNRALALLRLHRNPQADSAYRETEEYASFLLNPDNYTDSTPGTAQIASMTILVKAARAGATSDLRELIRQGVHVEEAKRILREFFLGTETIE